MKNRNSLSPAQEKVALLLAAGSTVTDAAAAVETSRQTVSEWQNLPAFAALVNSERQAARASAHGKLIHLTEKAAATLERLLNSNSERVALAAALGVLQHAQAAPIGPTDAEGIESANRFEALTRF